MKRYVFILVLLTMLFVSSHAQAVPAQWIVNGHYYEIVDVNTPPSYEYILDQVSAMTYLGMTAHLVTITSSEENQFLVDTYGHNLSCHIIGGFQPAGSLEPNGGWAWITGEPFTYQHWFPNEPNNANGFENVLEYTNSTIYSYALGTWNDTNTLYSWTRGYVVEYEGVNVPEPATMFLFGLGLMGLAGIRRKMK